MTEPTVLRGRESSTVWLGLSGACTWSGAAGAKPKLKREREVPQVVGEWVLTWDGLALCALSSSELFPSS